MVRMEDRQKVWHFLRKQDISLLTSLKFSALDLDASENFIAYDKKKLQQLYLE